MTLSESILYVDYMIDIFWELSRMIYVTVLEGASVAHKNGEEGAPWIFMTVSMDWSKKKTERGPQSIPSSASSSIIAEVLGAKSSQEFETKAETGYWIRKLARQSTPRVSHEGQIQAKCRTRTIRKHSLYCPRS